jgi:hypothetical protein
VLCWFCKNVCWQLDFYVINITLHDSRVIIFENNAWFFKYIIIIIIILSIRLKNGYMSILQKHFSKSTLSYFQSIIIFFFGMYFKKGYIDYAKTYVDIGFCKIDISYCEIDVTLHDSKIIIYLWRMVVFLFAMFKSCKQRHLLLHSWYHWKAFNK